MSQFGVKLNGLLNSNIQEKVWSLLYTPKSATAADYFHLLFTPKVMELIVIETNRNADQNLTIRLQLNLLKLDGRKQLLKR